MLQVRNADDKAQLIAQAARDAVEVLSEIQTSGGGVHGDGTPRLVLTGGSVGIAVLEELLRLNEAARLEGEDDGANADNTPVVDWSNVHIFFGDERNVDKDDPESNEGQARTALLEPVGVPEENIHGCAVPTEDVQTTAAEYAGIVAENAPRGFDLHLMGMGPEGHINSLFPHSAATAAKGHLTVGVTDSPKPPAERISLTFKAIARAQRVWLLVAGEEKAEAAQRVIDGAKTLDCPAAGVPEATDAVLYLAADASQT